ncbi:MAG: pirin family protein [Deferribacteres bacterium]|nr:pirin family protein [candidate division KSB1 bacterium]MCB9502763.1 pirin family protein [Deferribacteres bacterium]
MENAIAFNIKPMGFTWETADPFLFCVHHNDKYPAGNDQLGPAASLASRNLGNDFESKDGWRMYHGEVIPGFPAHPHRGFETVTVVLKGFVDHSDSHGAAGRYGNGDVQWMTAGSGLQHAEMFPLLKKDRENPLELFQIWLNLPRKKKFAAPHFAMLWAEDIPVYSHKDENGNQTAVTVIAGKIDEVTAPDPAPDSWAAEAKNEIGIWLVKMDTKAKWMLPPALKQINRALYFYEGSSIRVAKTPIPAYHSVDIQADQPVLLENGDDPASLLLLQGKPINEPVVQHGPFVMNSLGEIKQAFIEYQNTEFGGWPWPRRDNVHAAEKGRFAKFADGRVEVP